MDIDIKTLDLSTRAFNCLRYKGIENLNDLENYTMEDIRALRNMSAQSFHEIVGIMYMYGFELKDFQNYNSFS